MPEIMPITPERNPCRNIPSKVFILNSVSKIERHLYVTNPIIVEAPKTSKSVRSAALEKVGKCLLKPIQWIMRLTITPIEKPRGSIRTAVPGISETFNIDSIKFLKNKLFWKSWMR